MRSNPPRECGILGCNSVEDKEGCFDLSGYLGGTHAAKRFRPWNWKLHVPEVRFRRDELDADILLAVACPVNRNHAGFHRLRGIVVYKNDCVAHQHDLFQWE